MFASNEHSRGRVAGLPFSLQSMVVFLVCAGLVGAPALSTDNVVRLDVSNDGETAVVEKQQIIEVVLQSNLAVDHQWMLDVGRLNPDVLSEVGISDSGDSNSAYSRWFFRAKDSGFSGIKLSNKSLSDNTVFETFEVSVTVLAEPNERPSPFSLVVQHNRMNDVIVGQKCVFLMTVID